MPNWNKVIVSGSNAVLNSVTATAGLTGSLSGIATSAVSSSYALTASFALNGAGAAAFPYTGNAQINGSLGVTGSLSVSGSFNQGSASLASGLFAHVQGLAVTASGEYSHAEGELTTAFGTGSHAEGRSTVTSGSYSHAEGYYTTAIGPGSHAEGYYTTAFGTGSHAEGFGTNANGNYSHAEGEAATANGQGSHAEAGGTTTVSGSYSHAEGLGTVANGFYQHVQGRYNISSSAQSAFIIGNGTGTGALRSNLIFASGSLVQITGSLIVKQNATTGSLNTSNRTLQDDRNRTTIDWNNADLYDQQQPPIQSVAWNNRTLYGSNGIDSVQWDNRFLYDVPGLSSVEWGHRTLNDDHGTAALSWDVYDKGFTIASNYYYRSEISLNDQGQFVDTPESTTSEPNYAGEVITGYIDDTVTGYDLVYLNTDGAWYPVTQGTNQCTKLLGICLVAPTLLGQNPGPILLEGTITVLSTGGTYNNSPIVDGLDHGLPIYIENSYGKNMTTTAPTSNGAYVRVLGHAYKQSSTYSDYWIMKFRPSNDWITI